MKYGIVKDIWNGVLMGAAVSAMLFGAAKVNAAGAKEGIPEAYIQYCREAGSVYRVCPELLEAIMEEESGGNPDAVGSAGEIGLMQVDPKYHKGRGERLNVCLKIDNSFIFLPPNLKFFLDFIWKNCYNEIGQLGRFDESRALFLCHSILPIQIRCMSKAIPPIHNLLPMLLFQMPGTFHDPFCILRIIAPFSAFCSMFRTVIHHEYGTHISILQKQLCQIICADKNISPGLIQVAYI